jgi:hypothetical protein
MFLVSQRPKVGVRRVELVSAKKKFGNKATKGTKADNSNFVQRFKRGNKLSRWAIGVRRGVGHGMDQEDSSMIFCMHPKAFLRFHEEKTNS